jgi:hypothetical protein
MFALNEALDDPSRGVWRRTALASLCQTGAHFIEAAKSRETAAAFAQACLCIDEDAKRFRSIAELMDNASTRISLAMCQRQDMFKLFEEARVALSTEDGKKDRAPLLRLVVDNTTKD